MPWRFLSPWIKGVEKEVYKVSQRFENNCLYALHNQHIELNPAWTDYLLTNAGMLKIIQHCAPKNKFLEDYLSIFPDLENIDADGFKVRYRETLQLNYFSISISNSIHSFNIGISVVTESHTMS